MIKLELERIQKIRMSKNVELVSSSDVKILWSLNDCSTIIRLLKWERRDLKRLSWVANRCSWFVVAVSLFPRRPPSLLSAVQSEPNLRGRQNRNFLKRPFEVPWRLEKRAASFWSSHDQNLLLKFIVQNELGSWIRFISVKLTFCFRQSFAIFWKVDVFKNFYENLSRLFQIKYQGHSPKFLAFVY